MARRGLVPHEWRNLPRADRLEMLAVEYERNRKRDELLEDIIDKMPNEWGFLAQAIILALR